MDINDNNKFFKLVWRFNALIIAGAAVLFVILSGYAATKYFMRETRPRHVTNLVNVDAAAKVKNEFVLGYTTEITGTNYMLVPLYQTQSYDVSYFSKRSERNDVNYLFLNTRTGENKWLMPTTNQLFVSYEFLLDKIKQRPEDSRRVVGIFYTVAEKDTNSDGLLSDKDTMAVSYSLPDGSGYKKLIDTTDKLYSIEQTADDSAVILYEKNQETICEIYEIPSLKRLSQNSITKSNVQAP